MARNPAATARALLRNTATGPQPDGGFGAPPSVVGQPGPSPLVASYGEWASGRNLGRGLPRDWRTFSSGTFGPLPPMLPIPIDTPEPGENQPPPRRFSYPVSWNMPHGVPGDEGLGKLASFANLRVIGDSYSVARACIELRKSELIGLGWDVVPTKAKEKAMRGSLTERREFDDRRAKMLKFWRRPDSDYLTFRDWFKVLLEDLLVIDAMSIYLWPAKRPGKGVMGSDLGQLAAIDGSTIRPLLDIHGGKPQPPNPAWQAYEYGVPRVDLMSILNNEDVEGMSDALVRQYRGDQLVYRPFNPRDWTPYGFAPIEQALVPILSGIQRQQWQLDAYSERSIPGLFVSAGDPNATPNQLRELQDALNAMAGDPSWQHKIIVLPAGSKIDPQRPVELAGTFDEILMTQTCMAFSVMPMELGITPRSSTSGHSAGAANQMGKLSEDSQERKANRPTLEWFSDVFNHIIQNVCHQEDMQWWWEGLEADEDEQTKTDIQAKKVSIGMMSVDEARVENGEQPWGLPMTSEPVLITPTGVIPFGSIDPDTGQPAGLTAKLTAAPPPPGQLPPGAPGAGGISNGGQGGSPAKPPKPKPTNPTGGGGAKPAATPAHAGAQQQNQTATQAKPAATKPATTKAATVEPPVAVHAALRELDLIRRRLTKGRGLDGWEPEALPVHVFKALAADPTLGGVESARSTVKAIGQRQRRDHATAPARAHITAGLSALTAQLGDGMSPAAWLDRATGVMRTGIRQALTVGAQHARQDHGGVTKALSSEFEQWRQGFDARFDQYAQQAQAAYEEGYGVTTLAHPGRWLIRWVATSAVPCDLCAARDGNTYEPGDLPGWPGSGGFGRLATVCRGAVNCHCKIVYERDSGEPTTNPVEPHPNQPVPQDTAHTFQADLAGNVAAAQQVLGDEPAFDALLDTIADQRAMRQRQYLAGLLQDLLADLGRRLTPEPAPVPAPSAPDGGPGWVVPAAVVAADTAAAIGEQQQSQQQAAPATVAKAAGHDADAEHVMANLLANYPSSALGWVWHATWRGPVKVPTGLVDTDDVDEWAAHHQPDRVDHFTKRLRKGRPVRPAVSVRVPGDRRVKVVDGHHRFLAAKAAGKPFLTYVGDVPAGDDRWEETHTRQFHQGADPANKAAGKVSKASVNYRPTASATRRCGTCSMFRDGTCTLVAGVIEPHHVCDEWDPRKAEKSAGPVAAGLAVLAADTGRVLMLQRAVTDNDPASGTWEMPGGKLDPGETPEQAARREWSEETGIQAPDGEPVGGWTSPDGVYQGLVLLVPSEDSVPIHDGRDEVTNPDDPDGDQVEALAWWAPSQLPDNPAVRAELQADMPTVLAALNPVDDELPDHPDPATLAYLHTLFGDDGHEFTAAVAKVSEGAAGRYRARHLIAWYNRGAGGRIPWGAPGDWEACVTVASEHMPRRKAKGFCNLRHKDALGIYPATHAAAERHAEGH